MNAVTCSRIMSGCIIYVLTTTQKNLHIKILVALIKPGTVIANQYWATWISKTVTWQSCKHKFWNQMHMMMATLTEFIFRREGQMNFLTSFRSFSSHCYSIEPRDVYIDSGLRCFGNLVWSERHIVNCSLLWSSPFSININCITTLILHKSHLHMDPLLPSSLPPFI